MGSDVLRGLIITHRPVSSIVLKRLLLIFDEIYYIAPEDNIHLIPSGISTVDYGVYKVELFDYLSLFDGPNYKKKEEDLLDQFDYAIDKGLLRTINLKARKFYQQYWLPLRLAYEYDTADEELLRLSMQIVERRADFIQLDGVIRGMFISPKGMNIYPKIPEVPDVFPPHREDTYRMDMQCFSAIGKLNRSIAVAGEYGLNPIFVNKTMAELFIKKHEKIRNKSDKTLQAAFHKKNKISLDTIQYLLYHISQKIIPDNVLDSIPIKELVFARNNTFHELYKLRRTLNKEISFLQRNQFDEKFLHDSKSYIEKKIVPMLNLYNDKFIEKLDKFIKYSATFLGAGIGATIGLSQNLNPIQISFLSGVTAVVGNAISDLSKYVGHSGKDWIRNSFSYFYNFI